MTTTAPHPITTAAPEGVPIPAWGRAVHLVRTEVAGATSFWSLWCLAYRRHLRGHSTGTVFFALFDEYERAGGRGSAFEPAPAAGPDAGQDAAGAVGPTSDT